MSEAKETRPVFDSRELGERLRRLRTRFEEFRGRL